MTIVPQRLSSRWRPDYPGAEAVRQSMMRHIHKEPEKLPPGVLEQDLEAHILARLKINRERVIPWLDSIRPLTGSRILEIGCGTGASTLALAEQGAKITAIDVDLPSIRVAYDRCSAYGVEAEFLVANGGELDRLFFPHPFDWIIVYATLEHMTYEERIGCLKTAWQMLSPGSFLCIIDTPNRLWYFDDHTSLLPFFHWLPDDLAFDYSRFSTRANFKELYREHTPEWKAHFLSRGRGVSFHEFELAITPRQELRVAGCMSLYHRELDPAENSQWANSPGALYGQLLQHFCPDVHQAFLQPYLDFVLVRA